MYARNHWVPVPMSVAVPVPVKPLSASASASVSASVSAIASDHACGGANASPVSSWLCWLEKNRQFRSCLTPNDFLYDDVTSGGEETECLILL